jgi:hypothetical protein
MPRVTFPDFLRVHTEDLPLPDDIEPLTGTWPSPRAATSPSLDEDPFFFELYEPSLNSCIRPLYDEEQHAFLGSPLAPVHEWDVEKSAIHMNIVGDFDFENFLNKCDPDETDPTKHDATASLSDHEDATQRPAKRIRTMEGTKEDPIVLD